MEDQDGTLDKWKPRSQERVKYDGESNDGNCQEGAVPVLPLVVGYIQSYQSLDDDANHETNTSKVNLPPYCTKPT